MSQKEIRALYTDKTIRVYQAYNSRIAEEAVRLQTFGSRFKLERMTWIKPSFLWMMYRCGWASKEGQEHVLAIDITREGFEHILSQIVLSSFNEELYQNHDNWKTQLSKSEVRCQWDPERDIYGNPRDIRSIQIGIKGGMVVKYINEWIVKVEDITSQVVQWRQQIKTKTFKHDVLPEESPYGVDSKLAKIVGIT